MEDGEIEYSCGPAVGPAAEPIDFPQAEIHRGRRENVVCYNHETQQFEQIANVLLRDTPQIEQAYWPIKKKAETIMGHIEVCVLLERYLGDTDCNTGVLFQTTNTFIAIKVHYKERIQRLRHAENPINEIAAMQLIGNSHPNVQGCVEALDDGWTINVVMDYCAGGDLFDLVHGSQRGFDECGEPLYGLSEDQARKYFRDIVEGMRHLRDVGICHRDLSPENILIDGEDRSVIIDFGMCLRIPHTNPNGSSDDVTDAKHGTNPRLIIPQGRCGKLPYMTPEIYKNKAPFDGSAADVWTCGTILFYMLTGVLPYEHPDVVDERFYWMKRDLSHLLQSSSVDLSEDGFNLLRGMLRANFRMRLSLSDIESHPWLSQGND